jgi:hypothetical protein
VFNQGYLRLRLLCILGAAAIAAPAQTHTASDLAHEVLSAGLDPNECYHVRDVRIQQEDVTFYLTEGYLIFGQPVNGAPISAVFATNVEGGDGEVVLLPPDRAERRTLAAFTGSPNLNEHFTQALFFFTDVTARSLADRIRKDPAAERVPDIGVQMAEKWNVTVTNLTSSFETRIVLDLMTKGPAGEGFFDATLRGRKLGDFDVTRDARSSEQISVGKVTMHDGNPQWETWTRFVAASRRGMPAPPPEEQITAYNIDASMDTSLTMHCVTRMRIRVTTDSRDVIPFELNGAMRVISAKVDGVPAEFHQRDSLSDTLAQNSVNKLLFLVPPQPLDAGSEHDVVIVHEGKVVDDTGNGIYSVSARGTWYPGRGLQFAAYDATWHYPENLDLVSAGTVKDDQTANGIRTTHRVPQGKLRLLGFNLGRYTRRESEKNGITLEVSANREFEAALRPAAPSSLIAQPPTPANHAIRVPQFVQPTPLPTDPADRVDAISSQMLAAIEYFRSRLGDPPLKHIEVSPVTGRYGQGFAGMIYLPTLIYLNPDNVRARAGSPIDEALMGELLRAHEAAHQWWGNIVATDSYHHEWLMESLANYSALMFLESRMGLGAVQKVLDLYRLDLLEKGPDAATAESRGPIVEGRRLESFTRPEAASAVLYGKGTWIMHMLRRRLGDANFTKMLGELRRRYEWKIITTDEFRQLCAGFLPAGATDKTLTDFFDQWVYDTGMPTLKLTYSVAGGKLTGTVTQTDAPKDFSVSVPVEIRTGAAKPIVKMVRTANGPVKFTVDVPGPSAKATLDPAWSILRR